MSKYKLKNKPFEITDGDTRLARCWSTKKGAQAHLKHAKKLSKQYRGVDIYANFTVQKRTDAGYVA